MSAGTIYKLWDWPEIDWTLSGGEGGNFIVNVSQDPFGDLYVLFRFGVVPNPHK